MKWLARLFRGDVAAIGPAEPTAAEKKASAAMTVLDEAIEDARSLNGKLQALYASKGRDGFNAFITDVRLAEELAHVHHGPPWPPKP